MIGVARATAQRNKCRYLCSEWVAKFLVLCLVVKIDPLLGWDIAASCGFLAPLVVIPTNLDRQGLVFYYICESQEYLARCRIPDTRKTAIFALKLNGPRKTETFRQKQESCIFGPNPP